MKKLPTGRTLTEFQPLKPGEAKLLRLCAVGKIARFGRTRPTSRTVANTVRASFIRFLALGGDDDTPIHEHGIQLAGTWIEGELDLAGAAVLTNLLLMGSHFESVPTFKGAEIAGTLNLEGSWVPGLLADRLQCKSDIFLSKGFTAIGEVLLLGVQIGGNLECQGANLDGKEGAALLADDSVIRGSVNLLNAFTATGQVRLLGAQIGGDLRCDGATLNNQDECALVADHAVVKGSVFLSGGFTANGQIRLHGAQIGSALDCKGAKLDGKGGDALVADRAVIKGSFFLSNGFTATGQVSLLGAQIGGNLTLDEATLDGRNKRGLQADGMMVNGSFRFCNLLSPVQGVSLASAKVGRLIDDTHSWGGQLVLDGFVYEHLTGGSPTDARSRLSWLDKQDTEHIVTKTFKPQPWKQLQKVLRTMGHTEDARQIAIAFEDHLRALNLIGQTPTHWSNWRRTTYSLVAKGMHFLFKVLIGYGYRPLRLGAWMLAVWLVCGFVYWTAALQGVMAPSNPLVFQNKSEYQSCKTNWYLCEALPEEYTGFSPLAYSLDVLLPLVNLQQEQDWAPLIPTPKGTWYLELANLSFKRLR